MNSRCFDSTIESYSSDGKVSPLALDWILAEFQRRIASSLDEEKSTSTRRRQNNKLQVKKGQLHRSVVIRCQKEMIVMKTDSTSAKEVKTRAKDEEDPIEKSYAPKPIWLLIWLGVLVGVFVLHFAAEQVENMAPAIDQATRNLITMLVCILVLPVSIMTWFSFGSDWGTRFSRRLVFGGFLLLQLLAAAVIGLCIEFNGNLFPVGFHLPFVKSKDYQLTAANAGKKAIDLRTETAEDFPQFLGKNRDGKVPDVEFAIDWEAEQPKLLWRQPIGPGHSGFATRNGYAVTMEQRGDKELTTCYEIESGKLKWVHSEPQRHQSWLGKIGPRSTPTIYDGFVYSLGGNGTLVCLDGSNGKLIWKKELFEEFDTSVEIEKGTVTWGRSGSLLIYEDKVIAPAGGPKSGAVSLVAYDRKTGDEIWRAGKTQISYASPIVMPSRHGGAGSEVIVSVNESNVTAHDPVEGKIIWTEGWPGDSTTNASTSQPVVLPSQQLLLTKGYGQGARLLQFPGDKLNRFWSNNRVLKTKFTNAVYQKGYAYGLSDGRLECVDIRTGKSVWKSRKNYGHGQILLCGEQILILAEKGYLALVPTTRSNDEAGSRSGPKEVTKFQAIEGTTWNTIAVNGDKLLVRNSDEAACYQMPLLKPKADP